MNPEKVKIIIPKDQKTIFSHIYDIVSMVLVDGDISTDEYELCKKIARKYGIDDARIDELLTSMIADYKRSVNGEGK